MRMSSVLISILLLAAASETGFSQRTASALTYNMAFPMSRLNAYTREMSWRGLGFEFKQFMQKDLTVGVSLGWNIFAQLSRNETIQLTQGAVSGTNVRSVNAFPILANLDYFFGSRGEEIRPFIGINAGMYSIKRRFEIGVTAFEQSNWHFGIAPEAGFWVPLDRDLFLVVTGRYNYAFEAGETFLKEKNDYAYWGLNIGFGWSYNL